MRMLTRTTIFVLAAASVATAAAFAASTSGPAATTNDIDLVPAERNCWDPTRWNRPPSPGPSAPGCEVPPPRPARDVDGGLPSFVTHDLTPNRGYTLPPGTLQVVTFYDGDHASRPTLRIEYTQAGVSSGWIDVTDIRPSTSDKGQIGTFEYAIGDAHLTGKFEIAGIVPNGVVDGLAFGLFWRERDGFRVLRSSAPAPTEFATLVGTWPIALSDRSFKTRTPQIESPTARQQARATISGAEYLENGTYAMTIRERVVRLSP